MFSVEVDVDKSSSVVMQILAINKSTGNAYSNVFIDFKVNPTLCVITSDGVFIGIDKETGNSFNWEDTDALTLELTDLNLSQRPHPRNPEKTLDVKGISKVLYDEPTKSYYISTNTDNAKQLDDPRRKYMKYLIYMSNYRTLKLGSGKLDARTGKPSNYSRAEHLTFKSGYIPLLLLPESQDADIKLKLMDAVEATPLREGSKMKPAYDILGKRLPDYEMMWVSKKSAYDFIEGYRPGTFTLLGYEDITSKMVLYCLLEYAGLLDTEAYAEDTKVTIPDLPTISSEPFKMELDDLGIRRMRNA